MTARPIDRVLQALRGRLVTGFAPPGQLLPVGELSRAFNVSATPVREALAQLAGEGLVEDSRGRGHLVRQLTERDYRDACDLHAWLVTAGLAAFHLGPIGDARFRARLERRRSDGLDAAETTSWFFETIVASCGNGALTELHARLGARLGAARRAEEELLGLTASELVDLAEHLDGGDRSGVETRLASYHARRRAAASMICDHLRELLKLSPVFSS